MLLFILLMFLAIGAYGEPVEVDYTEPAGTGFTQTCVYSCVQHNTSICNCTPKDRQVCTDNQTTGTAVAIEVFINIPLRDGQLPACANVGVTTRDSGGNESALVLSANNPHVFSAP